MARGHPPPHCENTQVLREAITEDDDDDTMICYLNSKLDFNLFCAMDFRNLNSMVTWYIN